MPLNHDPDASVVALFKNHAIKNDFKSLEAGRPIFDDHEVVELRYPGSKNVGVYPALGFSHWGVDPETGEQAPVTYAERFPRQYRQFKMMAAQTKSGTPLSHVPFLTEARRAEMRALNIYTVEALAGIDGAELKNLGPGGRELKNQAMVFIDEAKRGAPNLQLIAELEALKARNVILEEDMKLARDKKATRKAAETTAPMSEFNDMTNEQLKAYITTQTGMAPQGNVARKTLVRMAEEASPDKVA
jgi:hypothetical protein